MKMYQLKIKDVVSVFLFLKVRNWLCHDLYLLGPWASIWKENLGPKGLEITDSSEDVILPNLTTDNPIDAAVPVEPAFNSQVTFAIVWFLWL